MNNYRNKLLPLLTTSQDILERYGFASDFKKLQNALEQMNNPTTTILVCGEFKRGKSSFINALLHEDICPVDIGVTTAAVSIIRYGDTPKVTRYSGNIVEDGVTAGIKTETVEYASIQDYVKGSSIDIANTIMLDIEVPNERLKSGLCVIDTPGVGSMDPRHLFLTLYALPKAEAIFFMTAAGEPMTETERDFYVHHIAPLNKPSRVLLNKADRFSTDAERDIFIADTVKKFTEVNIADITVLPISAEQWIEYNKSRDDFAKEISNMDAVLTVIENIQKEQEYGLIKNVASQFVELINRTGNSVQERLHSLQSNKLNEEHRKLQQRINDLTELQKQLKNEASPLRKKVSAIIKESQRQAYAIHSEESILLQSKIINKILDDAIKEKGRGEEGENYVIREIQNEIDQLYGKIDSIINSARNEISQMVNYRIDNENKTSIKSTIHAKEKVFYNKVASNGSISLVRQIRSELKECLYGAGLGLAIGGGVGAVIGLGAATLFAFRGIQDTLDTRRIGEIRQNLSPKVSIALNKLRLYISDELEHLQVQLIEAMTFSSKNYLNEIEKTKRILTNSKGDDKVRQENIVKTQKDLTFIIYVANELKNLPLK